jgi:uncharacterized protein (TIGR02246 family)
MKKPLTGILACTALLWCLTAQLGDAGQAKGNPQDMAAIAKNAEAFVEAFHKGDAKALATFWTPDGDYTDEAGKHLKGREAIEKAFKEFFAENKGLKLRINSDALRFVTPDVAVEDGTTEVISPDGGPPSRARYTIVHAKFNGQWFLASVRDAPSAAPTNYEYLRGLEWAIGDWVDDANKGDIAKVSFNWSDNQNFIVSTFSTSFKNVAIAGGTQWIGWDPVAKHIRSWTFDAHGGFGEGTWAKDGNKWTIKSHVVLQDGKKLTATNIVSVIDENTIGWQSKERTLDGQALPDIKEVKMKRVK